MLRKRDMLPGDDAAGLSARIERHLAEFDLYNCAASIGCYLSFQREVDTRAIIAHALRSGKRVAAPRLQGRRRMEHAGVDDPERLLPGPLGILQPDPGAAAIASPDLDLIIIPGLAFTTRGARLGFGGGYYDTYLAGRTGPVLGLAYGFQILDHIPQEPHDCRVDWVVTENGPIDCRAAGSAP